MNRFYEDRDLIAVEKPRDLISERTSQGNGFADLLAAENNGYIGVVHRLDRGVGGIMLYAKTPAAAQTLSEAVRNHTIRKEYLAVVQGDPSAYDGSLRDLLFHDRSKNKSYTVDRMRKGIKEAKLQFRTLETVTHAEYGCLSLLLIRLETGRTHQIRVQFASRGFPLFGDGKYGASTRGPIGLYSFRLSFSHPADSKRMTFSRFPSDLPFSLFPILTAQTTEQTVL